MADKTGEVPTPGGMPTLEIDCVHACVKGALPYLTEDDVHNLVEMRSCRRKKSMESIVTAANADDLQGALGQDDYAVVASAVKKDATAKAAELAAAKPVRQHAPPVVVALPVHAKVASGSRDVPQHVAAQAGIKNKCPQACCRCEVQSGRGPQLFAPCSRLHSQHPLWQSMAGKIYDGQGARP